MPERTPSSIAPGLALALCAAAACGGRTTVFDMATESTAGTAGWGTHHMLGGSGGNSGSATSTMTATVGGMTSSTGAGGTRFTTSSLPASSGVTSCPDSVSLAAPPLAFAGDLRNYSDRFTPSCRAEPGTSEFVLGWSVAQTDMYVFDTLGSGTDTVLAIYDGLCGKEQLACNDDDNTTSKQSRIATRLESGQFVTVVVDGWQGASGQFLLHVSRLSDLVNQVIVNAPAFATNASTLNLTDHTTSTCNDRKSSPDYTFSFEAPKAGTYQFSVDTAEFDPVLTLRADSLAGNEIACNDDFAGRNASVSYALSAGARVAVVVDGKQGSSGNFKFSVVPDPTDAGNCCAASKRRVGCIDPDITHCVCAKRASCCREIWDATCAGIVEAQGCGVCGN